MNDYMNQVALVTFSSFDVGRKPSEKAKPERFYHGFVLGLMVELGDRYVLTSNRESGFGRYDIVLEPRDSGGSGTRADARGKTALDVDAIIIEFKVHNPKREKTLEETVALALKQIEERQYGATVFLLHFSCLLSNAAAVCSWGGTDIIKTTQLSVFTKRKYN